MRRLLFALLAVAAGCSGNDSSPTDPQQAKLPLGSIALEGKGGPSLRGEPGQSVPLFSDLEFPQSPGLSAVSRSLPDWVAYPENLPQGLRGRNNCTFATGNATSQWNYYEDGACWERPGPDGWTRQQNHHVHVDRSTVCGNGPADVFNVRVCREAGEDSPCALNPRTGPNKCAVCVSNVTCLP